MRTLNERFTDEEFKRLKRKKGERNWREAILEEFGVRELTEAVSEEVED